MSQDTEVFERWPRRPLLRRALLWLAMLALFWSFMATDVPPRSLYEPLVTRLYGRRVVQLTFAFLLVVFFALPFAWERWHRLRFARCTLEGEMARFRLVSSVYAGAEVEVPVASLTRFTPVAGGLLVEDERASRWGAYWRPLLIPVDSEAAQARVLRRLEARPDPAA